MEELSFVPSAISVPQKMIFRCDNQCSEKTLSLWQFSSVVMREGEESDTANMCQMCHNDSVKAKGEKTLTNWPWREFPEQKAHRGRLWRMMGKEQYVRVERTHRGRRSSAAQTKREQRNEWYFPGSFAFCVVRPELWNSKLQR